MPCPVAQRPLSVDILEQVVDFGYGTPLVAAELGADIPEQATALLQAAALEGVAIYPVAMA